MAPAPCGDGPFDSSKLQALKGVTVCSAFLSVGGSAFILLTYSMQRTRRGLGMQVIAALSTADLISSLIYIIDGLSDNTGQLSECDASTSVGLCTFNAALAQFSGLAAILWTGMIAVGLHLGVLRRSKLATEHAHRLVRWMHATVWSASGFSVIVLAASATLGPTVRNQLRRPAASLIAARRAMAA